MSVRRFSDALQLLDWMLDAHERRPERKSAVIAHPDYEAMPTHEAVTRFEETLRLAAQAGAVKIEYGRKPLTKHEIARVRLHDVEALYRHLARERVSETAAKAAEGLSDLVAGRPEEIARIPGELEAGWARRKTPHGLAAADGELAKDFLKLLCGFLDGLHQDRDQRSFARRATGDSKALERRGQAGRVAKVLAALYDLEPGEPREVLDALGIRKFPSPICLSGAISVAVEGRTIDLSALRPYAALAPDQAEAIRPAAAPPYVMTVENFASFNRQVREIANDGLIVYTGGFPSRSVQTAIQRLDAELPESVPFFHWGDIDPWGLRIFHHIEGLLARSLRPHLMDRNVAAGGAPVAGNAQQMRRLAESDSAIADLAGFLASPNARQMEQEEHDPLSPQSCPAFSGNGGHAR